MSDSTMVVAAPAAVAMPTPAASPTTTADAITAPVDGAFTALLAAALGGGPETAAGTLPVRDATSATADVETEEDAGAPVAATAAAAGGDVGGADHGIAQGDAVPGTAVGTTGSLVPAAVVVPGDEEVPVEDGPVVRVAVDSIGRTPEVPPGPDAVALADGIEPIQTRRPVIPTATLPPTDPPVAAAVTTGAQQGASPAAGTASSTAMPPPAVDPTVNGVEAPVRTSPDPGTGTPAAPLPPAADVATAPASAPAPTGSSDLHARLVARVMDALDVLENAPPPRRLTVDLPDAEGLRLQVSLRGGEVHVSIVGGASGADLSGWNRDLTEALAARGFSLGGFAAGTGQDERRQPGDEGQPPADQPSTPRPRVRPRAADQDLRL